MKTFSILIIFLLFIQSLFSQTKSGEIIYKVKDDLDMEIIKDTLDPPTDRIKNAVLKELATIKKATPYLSYRLKFNGQEAIFEKPKQMINDNGVDLNYASHYASIKGIYYTDLKREITLNQFNLFDIQWLVKINLKNINWEIVDGTKKIAGYQCRKATTTIDHNPKVERTITVWFTPDLPFQFGPAGYGDLPGMILGLKRGNFYFYADKVNLSPKNKNIQRPTKGKLIMEEEFLKESGRLFKKKTATHAL